MPKFDPSREKIVIDILKDGAEPSKPPPVEEVYGMLPTRQFRRKAYRRPSGLASLIKFWDLGYYLSGQTNAGRQAPPFDMVNGVPGDYTGATDQAMLTAIQAEVLAIPRNDWQATFRRIEKGSDFEGSISVGIGAEEFTLAVFPGWKADGLHLTPTESEAFYLSFAPPLYSQQFFIIDGLDPDFTKVTSTPDINAPAVDFTPGSRMNVYIMPPAYEYFGQAMYTDGAGTHTEYLDYFRAVFDRNLFNGYLTLGNEFVLPRLRQARAFHVLRPVSDPDNPIVSSIDPLDYPTAGLGTYEISFFVLTNMLYGVVEKDGQWYYFWNNE